jgi:Protein of unknown function (DUF5131)
MRALGGQWVGRGCRLTCARRLCNDLSEWPTTSARVRRARAPAVCCASRTSTRPSIVATARAAIDAGASSRWPPIATVIEIAHGPWIRLQPQGRPATLADNSAIEWTEATWNPVTGCDKVSPGCAHCYAETFAERWRGIPGHPYEQGFALKLWPQRLEQPLKWSRLRMIFVWRRMSRSSLSNGVAAPQRPEGG